jgi:hypothetical protein
MSEAAQLSPSFFHDRPDDGFVAGVRLCACTTCRRAVVAEGILPLLPAFRLITEHDSLLVDASLLAEAMAGPGIPWLFYVPEDRLLEVAVAAGRGELAEGPQRWWSAACAEDDEVLLRQPKRCRVPRKQSKEAQRSREPGWEGPWRRPVPPAPQLPVGVEAATSGERVRFGPLLQEIEAWARRRGLVVDQPQLALVLGVLAARVGVVPVLRHGRDVRDLCGDWLVERFADIGVLWPDGIEATVHLYASWLGEHGLLADREGVQQATEDELRMADDWTTAADWDPEPTGRILPWPGG